jgi:hypothetical protein
LLGCFEMETLYMPIHSWIMQNKLR